MVDDFNKVYSIDTSDEDKILLGIELKIYNESIEMHNLFATDDDYCDNDF